MTHAPPYLFLAGCLIARKYIIIIIDGHYGSVDIATMLRAWWPENWGSISTGARDSPHRTV
jgi:hypothetical protein